MSNDEFPPPRPSDGSETGLGDLAAGPGDGAVPPPPSADATQVMPVTPSLPAASPGGAPPPPDGAPPAAPGAPGSPMVPTEQLPEPPWFKQPGNLVTVVVGVLLVGGVIALLFLLRGGDDEGLSELSPEPVSFVLVRTNAAGAPLDTTISASVVVQEPSPDSYLWVVPADGVVGEAAVRQTDATGRTEFRWAPLEDADAATWSSTVEFAEFVSPEGDAAVIDLSADCLLERDGSTEPLIVSVDVRPDQVDDSLTGIGTYTFPNIRFESGDRVECDFGNRVPVPPPTTVPESTTTVPESSTTAPETTTTAPETTTTVPETTTTSTTTTTTTTTSTTTSTTTTTTEAPPTDPSLGDLLAARPDLSDATELLDRSGLLAEIEGLDQPYTLFVPDNTAIQALRDDPNAPDLDDDAIVVQLLRAHLSIGESLNLDELAARGEIDVDFGGPQPLDAGASPPTIAGAIIIDADLAVDGGIVHVIDAALAPQP